jgi:hypothetical protein
MENLQVERQAPTFQEDSQDSYVVQNSLEASDVTPSSEAEQLPDPDLEVEPDSPQPEFQAAPSPPRSPSSAVEVVRAETMTNR